MFKGINCLFCGEEVENGDIAYEVGEGYLHFECFRGFALERAMEAGMKTLIFQKEVGENGQVL